MLSGLIYVSGPNPATHRFTNTAVPRFDGTGCWQQHMLVFQAITKSNGWSPDTAALQLFAHLDGEVLQVALFLPERIRERWKDFVDELSAYYNTPGRLVVFRRQLGILAIRGFSNMKEKARDLMVRNKFIASQQSCDLRRHLDSATPETSIGDIADSCIWSCEAGSHRQLVSGPSVQSAEATHVSSGDRQFKVQSRKCDAGVDSSADRELLISNVLEAVGARRNVMSERLRSR